MPAVGVTVRGDVVVAEAGSVRLSGGGRLRPGAEVFGGRRSRASRYAERQVSTFSPAIWAVAVTVQVRAASRAASWFRDSTAFFLVTTGRRIARSAALLPGPVIG